MGNHKTFFDSTIKDKRTILALSFDYQPRLTQNASPFYVQPTKGWNISLIRSIYKSKRNFDFGLNLNIFRRVEECRMQNIPDAIVNETKLQFMVKFIMPYIGLIVQKKYKFLTCFMSINIGHAFDDEIAWKYHVKSSYTSNICDTLNFTYEQHYSLKKTFPVMFQLGFIKNINKRFCIKGLIYNNEYRTTFNQNYTLSYCGTNIYKSHESRNNMFGLNLGIGYKF